MIDIEESTDFASAWGKLLSAAKSRGSITAAAKHVGCSRQTLYAGADAELQSAVGVYVVDGLADYVELDDAARTTLRRLWLYSRFDQTKAVGSAASVLADFVETLVSDGRVEPHERDEVLTAALSAYSAQNPRTGHR